MQVNVAADELCKLLSCFLAMLISLSRASAPAHKQALARQLSFNDVYVMYNISPCPLVLQAGVITWFLSLVTIELALPHKSVNKVRILGLYCPCLALFCSPAIEVMVLFKFDSCVW